MNYVSVKSSLSRRESERLLDKLKDAGLHPQQLYHSSRSGKVSGLFLLQVREDEVERAKEELSK